MLTKPLETSHPLKIARKWVTFTNSLPVTDGAEEFRRVAKMWFSGVFYVKRVVDQIWVASMLSEVLSAVRAATANRRLQSI